MANPLFPTGLQPRQLVTFFDPNNVSNTFNPIINMTKLPRTPGNVRKWTQTTNGQAVILGQTEYPPKVIGLVWNQMDDSDYAKLRAFTLITPIVMIDNNDQGFLGVLTIDSAEQLAGFSTKIWAVQASFLAVKPFNGLNTTISQLAVPTVSLAWNGTNTGYVSNGTVPYLWATVWTPWGESTPQAITTTTAPAANNSATLSFTVPTSPSYRKLRLYWNSANSSATATFLTDIKVTDSPNNSFTLFTNYIPYNTANPPAYGTAFKGNFAGGLWTNGT